jgi:outer membrane protein TolC
MEEAVAYGLSHNRALLAAGQEVSASEREVAQSRGGFLPTLDASYAWQHRKDEPYVSFSVAGSPGGAPRIPSDYTTVNHWQLELRQPLFTGFALSAALRLAELGSDAARFREETARLDLIREIKLGFLKTLFFEKLLAVAKENVRSLELHRNNAETYFEQGLTPRNDVLKAQVALAEAEQQRREAGQQLAVARARLDQLLYLDLRTELSLLDETAPPQPLPTLEELYSLAEKSRPEVLTLEASIRQADEQIRAARSGYFPRVSAFGQYYRYGNDLLAENNKFQNNQNVTVGVRLDWNLFDGGQTSAKVQEFEHRRTGLEYRLRDLKLQLDVQVRKAYEELRTAQSNIATARSALEQASESDRITALQYQEQLVIFLEVLNSQLFVLRSQVNYHQAFYGYAMALADLERAVGGSLPAAAEGTAGRERRQKP